MRKNNRNAFTLIEVVMAMAVMASGLFILTNSWAGTYSRLKKTQVQVQMAALLERKVTEIERQYKGKSLDSIPDEESDDFGSEVPGYSWKMNSKKLEIPDLSASLASQEGGTDSTMMMIMKLFTEYLSKSIKEVKVSIIFKEKKKPVMASVTIYIVDYDRPLPVPGAAGAGK
ncbi:MAG: prepilin-type N-terminal cleavage/methylation domain-containing protein [Bdellovibrionaceae bacterium]|nr:prepilin-type N-terminal cleavage/methylation domain-containing protein [Bdellovibrio sp.]